MYEIGDYIMHESSGVCRVTDISEKALSGSGSEKLYYSLEPVFDKGAQIITPVESAKRIRDISTEEEIKELLEEVPEISVIHEENNRARAEKFREQMSLFEPVSLASVVKSIYLHKEKRLAAGKKAMSSDERVMEIAERRLFQEMAFALDTDIDEVKTTFFRRLKSERDEIVSSVANAS